MKILLLALALGLAADIIAWPGALASDSKPTHLPEFQTLEMKILNAGGT